MNTLTRIAMRAIVGIALVTSLSPILTATTVRADGLHDRDHDRDDDRRRAEFDRRRREEAARFHDHHPVYAPAPVVYTPPPSPGISIVLPIEIR